MLLNWRIGEPESASVVTEWIWRFNSRSDILVNQIEKKKGQGGLTLSDFAYVEC
jgi:hypothetical protein